MTGRDHYLRETIPAGPRADREAEKVRTRLLADVDEKRNPRTNATIAQLLDRHLEMAQLDQSTLGTYRGYVKKHIRPLLGSKKVGQLDADVLDSFYAELRRCREDCAGRKEIDHRTREPQSVTNAAALAVASLSNRISQRVTLSSAAAATSPDGLRICLRRFDSSQGHSDIQTRVLRSRATRSVVGG